MKFCGKEFKRAKEEVVELDENGNPIVEEEAKKKGKKGWIIAGVTAGTVALGTVIYTKVLKKAPEPETVKEVAEAVSETVEKALDTTGKVIETVA